MNIYDVNETMMLIGGQYYSSIVTDKAARQITDICNARAGEITIDAATDVYVIGFINGIQKGKKERRR